MEELINGYTPVGDNFLAILCIILIFALKESFVKKGRTTDLIKLSLILLVISAAMNMTTYVACRREWPTIIALLSRDIYHGCLLMIFFTYEVYLAVILRYEDKHYKMIVRSTLVLNVIGIILDGISPLTHWGLYKDVMGNWHDSMWVKPFSLFYIINMIYLGAILLFKKDSLIQRVRAVLIVTQIVSAFVIIIQNINGHNSYLALTFVLPIIIVILMVHANSYNLDTGTLDAKTFINYMQSRKSKEKNTYLLCLKFFTKDDFVIHKNLSKLFYNFYQNYFKEAMLFNPSNGCYILAIKDEKNSFIWEHIKVLVEQEFPRRYERFKINYKIIAFEFPRLGTMDEFYDMFYFYMDRMEINTYKYIEKDQYDDYIKYQYISKQLIDIDTRKDMNDSRIKVYAQPIKNIKTGKFDTAEALMRLELPDIGMVFPDEFIPLAEEKGQIHTLSLIILNKVCKEISCLLKENYEVNRISVNFSVTELNNPNFVDEIKTIVKKNNLSFSKIGIELTESRNDADYATALLVVSQLKELGMPIYLDDFGTGYSNYDRILKLNVDVIKFDRSLLLLSDKDEGYRTMITYFARAFNELGYKVLYEGVENESHEELCLRGLADYLQGYHYSRPIPIEKLSEYFEQR